MFKVAHKVLTWLTKEALEKVNIIATWRELKELGRKHGTRFFIAATLWELIEDVVFPYLSWWFGHSELIPVFLVLHFEPIVYPLFIFAFRTWDRILGREPWEPDRNAQSAAWRTGLQALSYRIPAFALFYLLLAGHEFGLGVLSGYTVGMTMFGVVYDRLWHDSNFGIDVPTDTVQPQRIVAKALTYRPISLLVMTGVFGLVGHVPWGGVLAYQTAALILHLVVLVIWSRSPFGIRPVEHRCGKAA